MTLGEAKFLALSAEDQIDVVTRAAQFLCGILQYIYFALMHVARSIHCVFKISQQLRYGWP